MKDKKLFVRFSSLEENDLRSGVGILGIHFLYRIPAWGSKTRAGIEPFSFLKQSKVRDQQPPAIIR